MRRRRRRWWPWVLLLLSVGVMAPVVGVETACRGERVGAPAGAGFGIAEPGYSRPLVNSYLSYPEWAIVYAYQDLAGVMAAADEGAFDYGGHVWGFWRGLCGVTRIASGLGGAAMDERVMLYVIGLSFTAEMAIKGVWETTIGRAAAVWRGPARTTEDVFALGVAQDYAAFLQQTPWYAFPFWGQVRRLWGEVPFDHASPVRAVERRVALTMEWGGKALYALPIAGLAGMAPAEGRLQSVVRGVDASDVAADGRITVIRDVEDGAMLIETPRYGAFTEIVRGLVARERTVLEIAGNRAVLVTVLLPPDGALEGRVVFSDPVQARVGWRRVGLDVPVSALSGVVRGAAAAGGVFEHVYDY